MEAETAHIKDLRDLYTICKNVPLQSKSNFDPMATVLAELEKLLQSLTTVYNGHNHIYSSLLCYPESKVHELLYDNNLIEAYKLLFSHSVNLIFNAATSMFRDKQSSKFLHLTLRIYLFLKELPKESTALWDVISYFELSFIKAYSNLNLSSYKGNSVMSLVSFSSIKSVYPTLDPSTIINSHYFRLSSEKLGYKKQLVELIHLENGDFLFYSLNSGVMARVFDNGKNTLLEALIKGTYNLLDVEKKVMFAPFKSNDLKVIHYTNNGVLLETSIRNGTLLELFSENIFSWESSWKDIMKKNFDAPNTKDSHLRARFGRQSHSSLKKNEDVFKFDSLLLSASSTSDTDTLSSTQCMSPTDDYLLHPVDVFAKNSPNNSAHDLSSMEQMSPDSINFASRQSPTILPSFNDIESLSIENLKIFNDNINIELSPRMASPIKSNIVRSVSQTFTMKETTSTISKNTGNMTFAFDTDAMTRQIYSETDGESIISEEEEATNSVTIFNPSVEIYKPSLMKKKSSNSVLSLFSHKNKRSLTLNTSKNGSSHSIFDVNTSDNHAFPQEVKPFVKPFVPGPTNQQLEQSKTIFRDPNVKLTKWNGSAWMKLSEDKEQILIYLLNNNKILLCAYNDFEKDQCVLICHVTDQWSVTKTTAQDVQINFPQKGCVDHTMKIQAQYTISIRSNKADELICNLQRCMKGDIHKKIRKSTTLNTLSTSNSSNISDSIFSNSDSRSSLLTLENVDTNKIQYHLLLPNIKTRYYTLDHNKKWFYKTVGSLDVYIQEHDKTKTGIKFEFQPDNSVATIKGSSVFICSVNNVKKLKDTGLVINHDASFELFEFTSRTINEQVLKLIYSSF